MADVIFDNNPSIKNIKATKNLDDDDLVTNQNVIEIISLFFKDKINSMLIFFGIFTTIGIIIYVIFKIFQTKNSLPIPQVTEQKITNNQFKPSRYENGWP